ncbi:MAG TPA: hypothetical protein VKU36_02840 [Candidatus Babeliales bacterium]|nr:hypothetical protein [Candidatus Babeliales bacterium]
MYKITFLLLFFSSLYSMQPDMEQKYLLYKKQNSYGAIKKIKKDPASKRIMVQLHKQICFENETCSLCENKVGLPCAAGIGCGFFSCIASMASLSLCGIDFTQVWQVPLATGCAGCSGGCGYALGAGSKDVAIEKK